MNNSRTVTESPALNRIQHHEVEVEGVLWRPIESPVGPVWASTVLGGWRLQCVAGLSTDRVAVFAAISIISVQGVPMATLNARLPADAADDVALRALTRAAVALVHSLELAHSEVH